MSRVLLAGAFLATASGAASGQTGALTFDRAAYVTCKEAHAMTPDQRRALAVFLIEHSARQRGVVIPDEQGVHIGYLVRGGCTLSPDAYLFAVIDRAVTAELPKLPKRP